MKKFIAIMLLSAVLANFSACTNDSSPEVSENSDDSKHFIQQLPFPDIKISIPEDYETTSSQYIDEFYKKGDASVIVTLKEISESQKSMDNLVYDAIYQYKQTFDTLTEISEEDFTTKGYDGRIKEIRCSIVGEQSSLNMSFCLGYIIGKNSFYIITCSVPSDQYSSFSDEFKEIIKSAVPQN